MSFSLIKILSITIFVSQNQNLNILTALLRDHAKSRVTKNQYIVIQILVKSYEENNIFEEKEIYKFIYNYIQKKGNKLCRFLLYN